MPHPFPLRLRLRQPIDSDDSSPERGTPHLVLKDTHIALAFDKAPTRKISLMRGVVSDAVDVPRSNPKPSLVRRVTSKLNISIPDSLRSRPSTRTLSAVTTPTHRATAPPLPNSFVSKEHREAALRERGLRPPRKDFSEQEREADERLGSIPSPASVTFNGSSEAKRFKDSWLAVNRYSESSDSDCGPHASPYLRAGPKSTPTLPHPGDPPVAGRPSLCSSLPPLSIPSHLEVLHEEQQLSIPSPPIIVSGPPGEPLSPILVESPTSCTFSSHCPGSTSESQSQSDHAPPVPEKDSGRVPTSRRRTTDSGHRSRKVVGTPLTRFGTHSLTNLRRSMTDSIGRASTSTLSSADHASIGQAPRTAISPTIHSIGSIIKETTGIADAESRRLSELAFLD